MKFTASQQRALDLSRHLGITANAGSGKTRVLVERYVNILEQNPDISPRNVVAITFTDASAGELKTRIVREIDDRIASASSASGRARLESIRNDIKSGYIGTIHSFATRLLKAYPVEARIDANFSVILGAERSMLEEDAITEVFFHVLQNAYDGGKDTDLLDVFRIFGRDELERIMRAFLKNRSRIAKVSELLRRPEDDVIEHWQRSIQALIDAHLTQDLIDQYASILARSKECADKSKGMLGLSAYGASVALHDRLATYKSVHGALFTTKNTFRRSLIKDEESEAALEPILSALVSTNKVLSSLAAYCGSTKEEFESAHRIFYQHLSQILRLWDRVQQEYAERKTEIGSLDFDDLIEKAEQLLTIPLVASELTGRFRFIMIDEYQDTDETQYRIARALTEGFSDRNKLVVVGDPKQSIYSFRNADASVFSMTLAEVKAQQSARSDESVVVLQESFRMLAKPLAFINHIFGKVMAREAGSLATEEVDYQPLILGRTSGSQGSVEFLLHDEPQDAQGEDDGDQTLEMGGEFALIARKIRAILSSDSHYLVDDQGTLRRARAKDIAIIMRTRGTLPELEAGLRAEAIPYVVRKGAGFFSQQEITDILCYLKFLLSPADDISLVAILRSPFFALSDTLLFQIAVNTRYETDRTMAERPLTLWQRLKSYAQKTEGTPALLNRAIEIIEQNLLLVGRIPVARLIEKMFTESATYATYSAGPHGSQKIANVRKLIDMARQSDASGFSSLYDFVQRIEYLTSQSDDEAQADVTIDEDAVQILTAHGAKGLEFPIVIAASLHKKYAEDHSRILDKGLGFALSYKEGDNAFKRAPISELIRQRSIANGRAEQKRVLYVQLTRAKDHLILSGVLKQRRDTSALRWIIDAIAPDGFAERPSTIRLQEQIQRLDADSHEYHSEKMEFDIPVTYAPSEISVGPSTGEKIAPFELGKLMLDPIEVRYRPERFSATQLLTFHQCPTKYYLAFGLGIPEEPKLAYDVQPDELSEMVRGQLAGQIIHAMLEQVNGLVENGALDMKRFDERFANVCVSLGITREEESAPLRERARNDLSNFISHEFGKFVLSCNTFFTELPVQSQLDHQNSLYGIIDRLFQEPDGTWHLLDYKTDTKRRKGKQDQYDFQLGYYASLIKRLYPEAAQIKSTLFYTHLGEHEQRSYDLSLFDEVESTYLNIIDGIRINEKIPELKLLERKTAHCEDCNYYSPSKKQCVVPLD